MPSSVGAYDIEAELGRGGMGRVFRVRHRATGAVRALKLLDQPGSVELVARFRREAEALARLGGDGVVPIHELGVDERRPFYIMALMPGGSLEDRLARAGRLPWREAAALVARLARVLARAHAAGLIHRDMKPANVLFDDEGRPCIADFGCARDVDARTLTETGTIIGTPHYMALEQLEGARVDARADVYSLGVMLHELVAGERPYKGANVVALAALVRSGNRRTLGGAEGAPRELEAVVARALAPDPGPRYADAASFADALDALLASGGVGRGGARRGALLAAALALGVGVVVAARAAGVGGRADSGTAPVASASRPVPGPSAPSDPRKGLEDPRVTAGDILAIAKGAHEALDEAAERAEILPEPAIVEAAAARPGDRALHVLAAIASVASADPGGPVERAVRELRAANPTGLAVQLCDALDESLRLVEAQERLRSGDVSHAFLDSVDRSSKGDAATSPEKRLEARLAPLAGRPRLVGLAVAPLVAAIHTAAIANQTGQSQLLVGVVEKTPSLQKACEALPPEVGIVLLEKSDAFWKEDASRAETALRRYIAALEPRDRLFTGYGYAVLTDKLLSAGRTRLPLPLDAERILLPIARSDPAEDVRHFAAAELVVAERRDRAWALARARKAASDGADPFADGAVTSELDRSLDAARIVAELVPEIEHTMPGLDREPVYVPVHYAVALLVARGLALTEEAARLGERLDPGDPLRFLLRKEVDLTDVEREASLCLEFRPSIFTARWARSLRARILERAGKEAEAHAELARSAVIPGSWEVEEAWLDGLALDARIPR
jgi:hypothetical protein